MKKIIATLLMLTMVLGLCACAADYTPKYIGVWSDETGNVTLNLQEDGIAQLRVGTEDGSTELYDLRWTAEDYGTVRLYIELLTDGSSKTPVEETETPAEETETPAEETETPAEETETPAEETETPAEETETPAEETETPAEETETPAEDTETPINTQSSASATKLETLLLSECNFLIIDGVMYLDVLDAVKGDDYKFEFLLSKQK